MKAQRKSPEPSLSPDLAKHPRSLSCEQLNLADRLTDRLTGRLAVRSAGPLNGLAARLIVHSSASDRSQSADSTISAVSNRCFNIEYSLSIYSLKSFASKNSMD